MIKAILFDFDGTIVDSLKHHLQAYEKTYSRFGKNLNREEIIRNAFYTDLEEKTERYKITNKEKFRKLYFQYLGEAFKDLEVQQNLVAVLETLREKELKLAIISFAPSAWIKIHIKALNIARYFEVVLGAEDVTHQKPNPEIAEKAMQLLGTRPEETLLVGDIDLDILTGKNAKVMTSLFTGEANAPFTHPDFYGKIKPDFEFKNFSELPEKISRFL